MVLKWCVGL